MSCCPECFGDRTLRNDIFPLRAETAGKCSFCSSNNVPLLRPPQLATYFELLISAYRPAIEGKPLVQLLRDDWGLFDRFGPDDVTPGQLLVEITEDARLPIESFVPVITSERDQLGEWEKLRDELRYRNRFFPETDIDYERLGQWLGLLILAPTELPRTWFRARLQAGDAPFPVDKMGAPPREIAAHGRANPAGIPYLYLGSTELTAISETRPHTGEVACVADFEIDDGLSIIDLRSPQRTASPFLLESPEDIGALRSDLPFLMRLGQELTRPVLPQTAAIDYTPSQYLCEFIKGQGYDGVIYGSSVSDGMNLALFDPKTAHTQTVRQFSINRVWVDAAQSGGLQ